MSSVFSAANPILFGLGAAKEVGERAQKLGCTKVLLVYDKGVEGAGISAKITSYLEEENIQVIHFNEVQADPPDWSVEEAAKLGLDNGIDGVIGLGGGSSLDSAKGATLLQTNPFPLNQYFGRFGVVSKPSVPLIVIPTTAGTGSECTPGGVITDTKNNVKTNVNGTGCQVSLGIVDAELTLGLPKSVTASTGLDALCHAMESYTSIWANPFCDLTGREAIRLVGANLLEAYHNGNNLEARNNMMLAATLGGISMMGPFCHFGHDIGRALGAYYHIPHGIGCVSTMPQVLEYIAPASPERVRYIGVCLGADIPEDAPGEEIGLRSKEALQALMKSVAIPTLQSYGMSKRDLFEKVPPNVLKMGLALAPAPTDTESIIMLLDKAYEENVW